MSTVYIPRTVDTVEAANALPRGTLYAVSVFYGSMEALPAPESRPVFEEDDLPLRVIVPVEVDAVESQPLGMSRHGAEFIERSPFTCYIDYKETP